MNDWLSSFANPNFMPHGHCYLWQPNILWMHVVSDSIIALSYFTIPVVLLLFIIKQRKIVIYPEIFTLFVIFIFLCGTTHLASIYVTWHPAYEQTGWLKAVTALVSITTAVVLIPKLPAFISLPGIQAAYDESQQALAAVKEQKTEMQAVFDVTNNREARIISLKKEVNALLEKRGQKPKYLHGETA